MAQQWHKCYRNKKLIFLDLSLILHIKPMCDTVRRARNLRQARSRALGESLLLLFCWRNIAIKWHNNKMANGIL